MKRHALPRVAPTQRHGKGWCVCGGGGSVQRGKTRPDQTHTQRSPAPQIKMQPGHSICVPLPSSPQFQRLRRWSEPPTQTGPVQPLRDAGERREQRPALTPSVGPAATPPGVHSQLGLAVNLHRRKDSGEEQREQEGETSKPFACCHHSRLPNRFYYSHDYRIHTFNQKKHANAVVRLPFSDKMRVEVAKMKYSF